VAEHTAADVDDLIDDNITRPAHVLEALRISGIRSYVSAGTFWEEMSATNPAPVNLYAATRCAAKTLLRYYADAHGWSAIHLRVSDLYGPDDLRGRLFSLLREAVRTGRTLAMSPGDQLVDLVYVADAAAAFADAAERCARAAFTGMEEYGVSTGQPCSLRDVVGTYSTVLAREVPISFGVRPYRDREVMAPHFIAPVPGWTPSFRLADGIRAMEKAPGGLLST
jgi:nucleoside-diphosphate-sugar epimerase